MFVTKSEFLEWKRQETTKQFFQAIQVRISDIIEELQHVEADKVALRQGYLKALIDVYNTDYEGEAR